MLPDEGNCLTCIVCCPCLTCCCIVYGCKEFLYNKSKEQNSMLTAADHGRWQDVARLIGDNNSIVHKNTSWEEDLKKQNWKVDGETILMKAAAHGRTQLMQDLFAMNVNINEKDDKGKTALMHAAQAGELASIKSLYQSKADLNILTSKKENALLIAAQKGKTLAFELLLDLGGEIEPKEVDEKQWHATYAVAFQAPENFGALTRHFNKFTLEINKATNMHRDIIPIIVGYLNPVKKIDHLKQISQESQDKESDQVEPADGLEEEGAVGLPGGIEDTVEEEGVLRGDSGLALEALDEGITS